MWWQDGKGGHPTMQSLCVGGITPDGRDAVNELSYLFLSAEGDVGLGAEDMMVRINRLNPNSYVKHALETAKKLGGKLKFVSDDTSIQSMLYPGSTAGKGAGLYLHWLPQSNGTPLLPQSSGWREP